MGNQMKEKEEEVLKTKGYYYVCVRNPDSPLKLQFLKIENPSSQSNVQEEEPTAVDVMNKVLHIKKKYSNKRFADEELVESSRLTTKKQKRIIDNDVQKAEELIITMLAVGFTEIQVVDMILAADARRRRGKKLVVPGQGKKKFKCTICKNRSFFAHQGLDAHMSISHRHQLLSTPLLEQGEAVPDFASTTIVQPIQAAS
ncbi:hypothetical protein FRX31_007698 [Thalictrum thalictroides]|uniref:Uncharacterized protein n=1 Tax=Thalictrum thalictroides TaxID=46969 RepID=A0A7J6X056_THATH|nr:hypothetical protein FRX31_007698 [Thalictrum thalictroides]